MTDFRYPKASIIYRENVKNVDTYKYLGTLFNSNLKSDKNPESIAKWGQRRIHLMQIMS